MKVYRVLIFLRFVLIFTYGYLHPDEFFQSPSITSSLLFSPTTDPHHNNSNVIPWEFKQAQRSLLPILLTSGIPLFALKLLHFLNLTVNVLLFTPRLYLFLLSLQIDKWIERLTSVEGKVVYSALWPVLLLHTRTFSNTTESFALVALIYVIFHVIRFQSVLVGVVCAFGFFTRFTFPMFAWPFVIYHLMIQTKGNIRMILARIGKCVVGFISVAAICIVIDSRYYNSYTITPLNNLLYNTKTENLALHTLHPRYLHLLVNLPMLFGPLVLFIPFYLILKRNELRSYSYLFWLSMLSVVSGIGLLSLAPHQEARFLLPLTAPLVILYHQLAKSKQTKWIFLYSMTLCLFYGYLHQAGVIRSMSALEGKIKPNSNVVYEGTYMPPMYLLLMRRTQNNLNITDLAGSIDDSLTCAQLLEKVCQPNTYVVTSRIGCPKPALFSIFPHLSTEDIDRSVASNLKIFAHKC